MTTETPLVSFIIPAYNAEATIGAALSGALTQTHPRVEVVVVDDGSTDRTGAICAAYGDRIVYERVSNGGSSWARNRAMEIARGDFFAFLDADDVVLPPYLAANLATHAAAGGGRRIVMNEAHLLTATGLSHGRRLIGSRFPRADRQRMAALQKNFVPILSVFPRELAAELDGFDTTLLYCEDWDFWLRAILAGWEVVYQDQPHSLYRIAAGAKSTHPARHEAENEIVRRVRRDRWDDLDGRERTFVSRRLQTDPPRLLDQRAGEALQAGRWAEAKALYADVASLSSEDPRTMIRARLLAHVPGTTRLWRLRQQRVESAMGGRLDDAEDPASTPQE